MTNRNPVQREWWHSINHVFRRYNLNTIRLDDDGRVSMTLAEAAHLARALDDVVNRFVAIASIVAIDAHGAPEHTGDELVNEVVEALEGDDR